jgi:hypothetical protein
MKRKINKRKKIIFLSHSGNDKKIALKISEQMKFILNPTSSLVFDIFNTSQTQYRFKEFEKIVSLGGNIKEENIKWENELRLYLEKNLLYSDIYLLLVTKRSLIENSEWILFEMKTAEKEAKKRGKAFFIPCLYNGASFDELPEIANKFQAADINSEIGLFKLVKVLEDYFSIS